MSDREPVVVTSVNDAHTSPRGLFSLPREIRDHIYFLVLRPDCGPYCSKWHTHVQARRCTVLLQLSSQIYHEAIGILHARMARVEINNLGQLFRRARDFGKPWLFTSEISTTACAIPPRFCKLEFTRIRKLMVDVTFWKVNRDGSPLVEEWTTDGYVHGIPASVEKKLAELAQTAQSMTDLNEFHLRLSYCGNFTQNHDLDPKRKMLEPLLNAVATKGAKLFLGPHDVRVRGLRVQDQESLSDWLAYTAAALNIETQCTPNGKHMKGCGLNQRIIQGDLGNGLLFQDSHTGHMATEGAAETPDSSAGETIGGTDDTLSGTWNSGVWSNSCWPTTKMDSEVAGVLLGDYTVPLESNRPYQLIPECRTCFEVFKSWDDLGLHLVTAPSHRRSFQKRSYNTVVPWAKIGGKRKCWTCAAHFPNLDKLHAHLNKKNHRREGMIPRFTIDNNFYERLHKEGRMGIWEKWPHDSQRRLLAEDGPWKR